jgi:ribonuclease BN (tRNA processing enzyme)
MKITIVGYWGSYPEEGEATTCYLLQTKNYNILIDCGSGALAAVQKYISLDDIDAIILSHYHWDHIADVFPYQYNTAISFNIGNRKRPLEIYGHKKDNMFDKLKYNEYCIAKVINEKTILNFDSLKVSFTWCKHPVPSLAMKFEENGSEFVFSGDTEYCEGIVEISKNADIFLCECSFYDEQYGKLKGHLTAGEVGEISQKSNVKTLVLTHLPHYGDIDKLKEQALKKFEGKIEMAYSGKIFEI